VGQLLLCSDILLVFTADSKWARQQHACRAAAEVLHMWLMQAVLLLVVVWMPHSRCVGMAQQ
jgi:uncharacterized membrane protein YidH (DUF202 family)